MRYFRHIVEAPEATIYPIVCMHIGAPQSDEEFIKEHIARIASDKTGFAVYMGDAGECITKQSKGNIYHQTMSPGEQQVKAKELLDPIVDQLLFGISGNHGRRIDSETGISWDETFCLRLGIPYLGASCFMRLDVGSDKKHMVPYDLFFHHGATSPVSTGGKVARAKKFEELVEADAVFTAHSHICCEIPPTHRARLEPRSPQGIYWRDIFNYICGCAYDSRSGYAEEKGYSPILPAYLGVAFNGKDKRVLGTTSNTNKRQRCTIWRAEK